MLRVVGFDGDDTLWETARCYQEATERFVAILSSYCDPERVAPRLRQCRSEYYGIYGWSIKSFVLSMIEVAASLAGTRIEAADIRAILDIGRHMMTTDIRLKPGATDTLAALSSTCRLVLISMGDPVEQRRKLDRSGLAAYFSRVELGVRKSPDYYRGILLTLEIDPDQFLMIGDSLEHDVLPVVALGGRAVYVPSNPPWWEGSAGTDSVPEELIVRLDDLGQVPAYVAGLWESAS